MDEERKSQEQTEGGAGEMTSSEAVKEQGGNTLGAENKSQTSETEKKKGMFKWGLVGAAAVFIVLIAGIVLYMNGSSYKAKQALKLGEKYLSELKYEQAIAEFQRAIELDPKNSKILDVIFTHMEEILDAAQECGSQDDYAGEREMVGYVVQITQFVTEMEPVLQIVYNADSLFQIVYRTQLLLIDADRIEWIAKGKIAYGKMEFQEAKESFDAARENGATEEQVNPNAHMCELYLELIELCDEALKGWGGERWNRLFSYLDSEGFKTVSENKEFGEFQKISGKKSPIIVGKNGRSNYLILGDPAEKESGEEIGVFSSDNTYALYVGEWQDNLPQGKGELTIGYKNNYSEGQITYRGIFANGLLDGRCKLSMEMDGKTVYFDLNADQGDIFVVQTDEEGNHWLCDEMVRGGVYVLDGMTVKDGKVVDYKAGVPCLGGSDMLLPVKFLLMDKTPPVLFCDFNIGQWYREYIIGKGITAIDDCDGEIKKIEVRTISTSTSDWVGNTYFEKTVNEYSATDSAGNTGTLTIVYEKRVVMECLYDIISYRIVSVE